MRINSINNNYNAYNTIKRQNNAQNFRGIRVIDKADEPVVNKMLGYKRELFNKITDEKGIDIFLFGKVTKADSTSVPAYAGIIQEKDNRVGENGKVQSVASFKCTMTNEGLIEARNKVETAVIWANAPANLIAMNATSNFGKTEEQKEYAKKLQNKMIDANTNYESKVWKQKLEILLTRDSDEI